MAVRFDTDRSAGKRLSQRMGVRIYESKQGVEYCHNSSLRYADLTNVKNLEPTQLLQVKALMKAILPEGNLYNGRFNLIGDIKLAKREGYDIDDPHIMAEYYGVTLENYLQGQQWSKDNLYERWLNV